MKKLSRLYSITLILTLSLSHHLAFSQNKVGLGVANPEARLHIKGVDNISQLCIDADTQQTNLYPLIRLRKSDGTDLMWINTDHPSDLFMGLNTGRVNVSNPLGSNNTFLGANAGYSNTVGINNTAVGKESLNANIGGNDNTALGSSALGDNESGNENTAIGAASLFANTSGTRNTAIGYGTLFFSTSASDLTAVGHGSLEYNTSGTRNSAVGSNSLTFNTTGNDNTAVGYRSLWHNTTGVSNTAIGTSALGANTTGDLNTAIGGGAMENNTTGDDNTAIGRSTLNHNSTGIRNTALGGAALTFNTNGQRNTACGHYALHFNSLGNYNSAIGNEALYNNTTGSGNAAFGYQTLYNNTTQIQNTAFGNESLINTTANGNTALGFLAGHDFDNGDWNTFLGIYADANAAGYTNSTAIGNLTEVTASNQVRIGAGVTSIGGPQNWTNTSDRRIKVNIKADVPGIAFINLLQPVTYNKSIALEEEIIGKKKVNGISPDNPYETLRYSGFIAQDVEAAAQSIGYEFSGVDAPQNDKSLYGLRYAEFVVPLVKAVQELTNQNVLLQAEIELLKTQFASLQSEITSLKVGK